MRTSDTIFSFAQLLALIGQFPKYVSASSNDEQIFLPAQQLYHCPMDGYPGDASLKGGGIYINGQQCKPVHSALAFGRSFQAIQGDNEKSPK